MGENNLSSLKLNIAGKILPVKVTEAEIPLALKAEKELNNKINEFQVKFKDVDKTDSILMVLLSYAFEKHKKNHNHDNHVSKRLSIIEQLVEESIS